MRTYVARPTLFDGLDLSEWPERTISEKQKPRKPRTVKVKQQATRHKEKTQWNESRQTDGENVAAVVRGVLIARLDALMLGPVRAMCEERYGLDDSLFLPLMNDVVEALFPEEFSDGCHEKDENEQATIFNAQREKGGVIPRGGVARVSVRMMARFAAVLKGVPFEG